MIWSRGRQTNGLRSAPRGFCPAGHAAFDDLSSGDALEVLQVGGHPGTRPDRVNREMAALRCDGRQRRIDERAADIQPALRAPQLASPAAVSTAVRASVAASVAVIAGMDTRMAVPALRSSKRVLRTTRTLRWSAPCQD